jgi:predicted site-specific integrase-resolvase
MFQKQGFPEVPRAPGFWPPLRVSLYARISTLDQRTLPLQIRAMREYAFKRGWTIIVLDRSASQMTAQHLKDV